MLLRFGHHTERSTENSYREGPEGGNKDGTRIMRAKLQGKAISCKFTDLVREKS